MTPAPIRLYIDDIRNPPDATWTVARTFAEAEAFIRSGRVGEVSFDHDLGDPDERRSGEGLARILAGLVVAGDVPRPRWTIHSANVVGAKNIRAIMGSMERVMGDKP